MRKSTSKTRRSSQSPRMMPPTEVSSQQQFLHKLDFHREQLGWSESELAKRAGIQPAQFSHWRTGIRGVPYYLVNRLTYAIAQGYNGQEEHKGADQLAGLINDFLIAAGYRAVEGCAYDLVWTRMTKRTGGSGNELRIGWAATPPFLRDNEGKHEGLAVDISEFVSVLLGVNLAWIKLDWNRLIDSLIQRQVDIIAPILRPLPIRLHTALFSMPVLKVGVAVVVHTDYKDRIILTGTAQKQKLDSTQMLLHLPKGGWGTMIRRIIAREAEVEQEYDILQEGVEKVLKEPTHGGT